MDFGDGTRQKGVNACWGFCGSRRLDGRWLPGEFRGYAEYSRSVQFWTRAQVLENYPTLSADALRAVFAFSAQVLHDEALYSLRFDAA